MDWNAVRDAPRQGPRHRQVGDQRLLGLVPARVRLVTPCRSTRSCGSCARLRSRRFRSLPESFSAPSTSKADPCLSSTSGNASNCRRALSPADRIPGGPYRPGHGRVCSLMTPSASSNTPLEAVIDQTPWRLTWRTFEAVPATGRLANRRIQTWRHFSLPTNEPLSTRRWPSRSFDRRMPTDVLPRSLLPRLSALIAEKTGLHFPPERQIDLRAGTVGSRGRIWLRQQRTLCRLAAVHAADRTGAASARQPPHDRRDVFLPRYEDLRRAGRNHVLPQLIARAAAIGKRLRIWSAALQHRRRSRIRWPC